jgi:hypothetical protein
MRTMLYVKGGKSHFSDCISFVITAVALMGALDSVRSLLPWLGFVCGVAIGMG